MPGAGGSRAFANPAFYGNVQMLTNSAMNQFQNQRYSLENQLRESRAEQKALLTAGRAEAAQIQGRETATLQTQLADTIKMFTGVTAQLAQGKGQLEGVAAEKEQQRQEQETQRGQAAGVERLTDVQLKEQIAPILAQSYPGFTPQGIKSSKFTETKGLMRKVLAYDDAEDKAALIKAFSRTARAKQSAEPQDPEISGEGESLYFSDDPSMELGDQDM